MPISFNLYSLAFILVTSSHEYIYIFFLIIFDHCFAFNVSNCTIVIEKNNKVQAADFSRWCEQLMGAHKT